MKYYIYLAALAVTFYSQGMDQRALQKAAYDQQFKDAVANDIFKEENIKLAIDALQHGADPDTIVSDWSVKDFRLLWRILRVNDLNHRPLFDALIDAVVDVDCINEYGETPLGFLVGELAASMPEYYVSEYKQRLYYIQRLLRAGASMTAQTHQARPRKILYSALIPSMQPKLMNQVLKDMIAAGAPINMHDDTSGTPIGYAAYVGNPKAVKTLLRAGAYLFAKDKLGRNVLDYARMERFGGDEEVAAKKKIIAFLEPIITYQKTKMRAILTKILRGKNPEGQDKAKNIVSTQPQDILDLIADHVF